ncbi:MAG TPA: Rne/Rng family ribonuclease [Gemmatimonadota bacterium]|nr:Rne/Rng family ribonuclease [Gemmatimonadota bacterium]
MKREILVNVTPKETRVAILEDEQLVELLVDREEEERHVGDIYKGLVTAVLPGMQSAFVDVGMDKSGFLHVSDLASADYAGDEDDEDDNDESGNGGSGDGLRGGSGRARGRGRRRGRGRKSQNGPPIQEQLKRGQDLIVQVTKEAISTKGPRLTGQVSLPGRFLVFMPGVDHIGISRKIDDRAERMRLRQILREVKPSEGGLIVRTAAEETTRQEFEREVKSLVETWRAVVNRAGRSKSPALLHQEAELTSGLIRDIFSDTVDRLLIDERNLYHQIRKYLKKVSPDLLDRVKLYTDRIPIFDALGIEPEIELALERTVRLKSGGSIVIEPTEALVSIDVNTGRYTGKKDPEATILRTNLDAAREIARQLRLRDIGGIIVCDFIDMELPANRKKVLQELKSWLGRDRAKTKAFEVSELGLIEMTRQRRRPSLYQAATETCEQCAGSGRVLQYGTLARRIERQLRRVGLDGKEKKVQVRTHPAVALHLLEQEKDTFDRLTKSYGVEVELRDDPLMSRDDFDLVALPGQRPLKLDLTA